MITDFVKMWITEDQSFTLLFFIGKFFNQSCTIKFPTIRPANELCRHAILGIVRNFET